jgi:hypothetical protein
MSVQTRSNPISGIGAVLFDGERTWLWTWSGKSFGYREGDRLFTLEGLEAGRFVGREVYGPDGSYLGEVGPGDDAVALATNLYKRDRTQAPFVPTLADPRPPRPAQPVRPFYAGYEDFPSSWALLAKIWRSLPAEIQRVLLARRKRVAALMQ